MDIGTGIAASVGIVTVVSGLVVLIKSNTTSGKKGFNGRPKLMTEEARTAITDLYNKKVDKELCKEISTEIKSDISEVKTTVKEVSAGVRDIQQTLINWKVN